MNERQQIAELAADWAIFALGHAAEVEDERERFGLEQQAKILDEFSEYVKTGKRPAYEKLPMQT